MSIHVNYECHLCTANNIRNQDNNAEILESVTDSTCIIDGVLHQHHSRGANAFEIVASTGQVYVPHITNDQYMALVEDHEPASVFARFIGRLSHILIHMPIGSVVAIPTADGVMLVRLTSEPMTGAMTGRFVFSFSGRTTPYCGGAEGADTLLHVDDVLVRPGSTQPFHTAYRNIEVIGYLSPGSRTYVRIMNTQQVTTTVKMIASRADIKPTLAEAMSSVSVVPIVSASASASASATVDSTATTATVDSADSVDSDSDSDSDPTPIVASNSSVSTTTEEVATHLLCQCYPDHEAHETKIRDMLAIARETHGTEFIPVTGCSCPICTCQVGQCVQCFGSLLNEGSDDCV